MVASDDTFEEINDALVDVSIRLAGLKKLRCMNQF
ncbi:Uncharacterised protein [Weissella viridescens]|uniref:Uncharacterized protein n=1 Tax=Weissella viridescens TaxID=1629 RepID=A0A380P7E4_WEIVI|nr:Uncharacterised protein [Weissella viridescens]